MAKIDVLKDAQDLAIITSSGRDSYIYAVKPSLHAQKKFYDLSLSNPSDTKKPVFQKYWEFDKNIGIMGTSTFLALRFDKLALRPSGLWIPELLEAKVKGN